METIQKPRTPDATNPRMLLQMQRFVAMFQGQGLLSDCRCSPRPRSGLRLPRGTCASTSAPGNQGGEASGLSNHQNSSTGLASGPGKLNNGTMQRRFII